MQLLYLCEVLLPIHPVNPEPRKIKQVADILRKGGIAIIPTDTIYAYVCDIYQARAFEKICRLKEVKPNKANFSLLCSDLSNISQFARPFDRSIYKLLNRAFPGAYTFILEASSEVPGVFRDRRKTIGLRIPDHAIIQALLAELGHPMVVASLHDLDSIRTYPTDPEIIDEEQGHDVDIVVDGGAGNLIASTVIDCTADEPEVVREGAGDVGILN